jgi:hypothetical protein
MRAGVILRMPETRAEYDSWLVRHGHQKLTDQRWVELLEQRTRRSGGANAIR